MSLFAVVCSWALMLIPVKCKSDASCLALRLEWWRKDSVVDVELKFTYIYDVLGGSRGLGDDGDCGGRGLKNVVYRPPIQLPGRRVRGTMPGVWIPSIRRLPGRKGGVARVPNQCPRITPYWPRRL